MITPDQVLRMISYLRHRGPDEAGVFVDDWVGLGHTRLSVVDLESGTQPIHDEAQRLWIVYNGEVFNFPELRKELIGRGHRFYTASDTEVILHLFEEKGIDCLDQLNGQFAMAIWDAQQRQLVLVRDRLGIRPLHYAIWDGKLVFASEIKAIFAIGSIPRRIDPIAMDQVFTFWSTLPGRSGFDGVYELPAGCYLLLKDGRINIGRYWDVPIHPEDGVVTHSLDRVGQEIYQLLDDAVRIRLRADVPVGCYISGGLDSSGVAALTNRYSDKLRTFGIRFERPPFDEGNYQQMMVSHLNVDHSQINATGQAIGQALPEVVWHCERPLLRTAPVPLFLLSDLVHQSGMKVVLTGEGADEVFGGYDIFKEAKIRRFWARDQDSDWRGRLIERLYQDVFTDGRVRSHVRSFFGKGLQAIDDPFYSHRIRWTNTARLKALFSDDLRSQIADYDPYQDLRGMLPDGFARAHWLCRAQYLETKVFLSQYLLSSQGDRVAMAHSVEIRLPYLDYRLVEFMVRIPPRWKILGLDEKHLLKRILSHLLPDQITSRTKHPYRAPIRTSLLNPQALAYIEPLLSERSVAQAGLLDPSKVYRLLQKAKSSGHLGEVDSMGLVGVVTSQLVYEQFIRNFRKLDHLIQPKLLFDRRSTAIGSTDADRI